MSPTDFYLTIFYSVTFVPVPVDCDKIYSSHYFCCTKASLHNAGRLIVLQTIQISNTLYFLFSGGLRPPSFFLDKQKKIHLITPAGRKHFSWKHFLRRPTATFVTPFFPRQLLISNLKKIHFEFLCQSTRHLIMLAG